jgi:hypothetical protein
MTRGERSAIGRRSPPASRSLVMVQRRSEVRLSPFASGTNGSPGMIVGDDTRTRVRTDRSETRHPRAAPTLARPREDPGARTAKRRSEKGMEQAARRRATAPVNAGSDPNAPKRRHDHPDAPARRRGRPWPLEHASAMPTDRRPPGLGAGSTTRPQRRTRLPPARRRSKAPAQGRIPVESHLPSSTEPRTNDRSERGQRLLP